MKKHPENGRYGLVLAMALSLGAVTTTARAEQAGSGMGTATTEPPPLDTKAAPDAAVGVKVQSEESPYGPADTNRPGSPTATTRPPTAVTTAGAPIQPLPSGAEAIAPAPMNEPAPVNTPAPAPNGTVYSNWMGKIGAGLLVGGGFEDFTNDSLRSMTGGGGYWNARAVAGTRQYVGLEAAYIGAARSINTLGLNDNAGLVSNGFEGALRINVPVIQGRSLIEPFGFVGLGWQHYSLTNTNVNTSDVASKDDVMTVPYGAGLEYSYGMFMADARFTYRQTYLNDLLRTSGGRLNNWGVGAQLGVEF